MSDPGVSVSDISQAGFLFLPAPKLDNAERTAFARTWDDLPQDAYLANGDTFRQRRYARFAVSPNGHTRALPHRPFTQSSAINAYAGDTPRDFPPMTERACSSPALHALLRETVALLPDELLHGAQEWHIDTHQVRTIATPTDEGRPSPEGPHRDGMTCVRVVLIDRAPCDGGESVVTTHAGHELDRRTLTEPYESLALLDEMVLHDATPIRAHTDTHRATRDTLLFGLRPYSDDLDNTTYAYGRDPT